MWKAQTNSGRLCGLSPLLVTLAEKLTPPTHNKHILWIYNLWVEPDAANLRVVKHKHTHRVEPMRQKPFNMYLYVSFSSILCPPVQHRAGGSQSRAAVTLRSSQWLENHKRGWWAPSCPLIGWLQEQQRAITKLSWAVCCSAPTVCQQCGGECWRGTASSRRQCLFVGMLVCVMTGMNNQPHPVLPRTHHPLPPEKHYVGHSATR